MMALVVNERSKDLMHSLTHGYGETRILLMAEFANVNVSLGVKAVSGLLCEPWKDTVDDECRVW